MRVLLSVLLLLLLLPSWSGDERVELLPSHGAIATRAVTLDSARPDRRDLGELTYLGGVELTGPGRAFGGFSAMAVAGDRFTLLSDAGAIVQFRLGRDWQARDVRFGALPEGPGIGWHKSDWDSESLTRDPVTGRYWIGFETANQIWRYSPDLGRAQAHAAPPTMARWTQNAGAEAMVRLRDGGFIVLGEDARGTRPDTRQGIWFAGDPTVAPARAVRFSYRPPPGFRPVDLAELPDGRLIVLNRRFSLRTLFTASITLVERSAIRAGRVAQGREIARFEGSVVHDNFEALAVTQEAGATMLWIASDDNQAFFQRSLLLKFRLNDRRAPPGR
jgi:hypothetical protein